MKNQEYVQNAQRSKVVSIMLLYIASIVIILLGASFSVFSAVNNISFTVLDSKIPGLIFGVVVLFLGVRYFLSVRKLKAEVYKASSKFSWYNFKKEHIQKSLSKSR
ncbi:MAG: hypothetical protein Q8882_07105 [Bacillota bacterium]|nr:hypothetical protein [Bacillota bacterium]